MKPTKMMMVRNEIKAGQIRPYLSEEWMVCGFMSALTGRRFDVIMIVDQPEREIRPDKWVNFMGLLATKLKPDGQIIEIY